MSFRFRVAARTLIHLGAELISSDEIALYELIKNSFDARSPRVRIELCCPFSIAAARRAVAYLLEKGAEVSVGRSRFEAAFYIDAPREVKRRLSKEIAAIEKASSLAAAISAFIENECLIQVVDDGSGMGADLLETAFLVVGTSVKAKQKAQAAVGEKPLLGDKGIGRLSMMRLGRYARVESFREKDATKHCISFDWSAFSNPDVYLDDVPVKVEACGKKDRNCGTSIRIWGLNSDWNANKVQEFARSFLGRLQNPFRQSSYPFPIDLHYNGGPRVRTPTIPTWLLEGCNLQVVATFKPPESNAYSPGATLLEITTEYAKPSTTNPGAQGKEKQTLHVTGAEICHKLETLPGLLAGLGSFDVDIYWYNRANLILDGLHTTKDFKSELDRWAGGLALYRDGFRIGLSGSWDDDWLMLDSSALRKGGYVVNRLQVIGAVSLSASENPKLIDRSNREGLIDGPEKDLLQKLLLEFVVDHVRAIIGAHMEAQKQMKLVEATSQERLAETEDRLRATRAALKEIAKKAAPEARGTIKEIETNVDLFYDRIRSLSATLKTAGDYREEVLELAGVGLVVEVVLHELARMTKNARDLILDFGDETEDPKVKNIVGNLEAQLKAINKRIRAVDPLSVSGRQRKEVFDLKLLIDSSLANYENRFKRHKVKADVVISGRTTNGEVRVNLVRGLIAHIFENLLSNSVYWLQHRSTDDEEPREIHIEIDAKSLAIIYSDNGPGVSPEYKDMIFKPGFSLKPKNQGKGLGLFIAREIAEYHGAKFYLDPSPGKDGRLRTFIVELPSNSRA